MRELDREKVQKILLFQSVGCLNCSFDGIGMEFSNRGSDCRVVNTANPG